MADKNIKTKKERLVLLDAHAILHRAYHALPDFATAKGEPTGALYGLSAMLIKIIESLKPDYIVACYDVKGPTYRHEAYKEYKAGRKPADNDLVAQMKSSRDIFSALDIPIYDKQGFEADDMLGTIVEQVAHKDLRNDKSESKKVENNLEIIIASGDMDTLQLVSNKDVMVYTLKKGINDTIMYDEEAVRTRFGFGPELIPDYKGLRGDPSDNIIGVKGIGEKTATILLTTFGSIENIYKELETGHDEKFSKAGLTPRIIQLLKDNKEEAEFSKVLATIRRDAPIDFILPQKRFKEGLDIKKISNLWHELEFRTLTQRLEKALFTGVDDGKGSPPPTKISPDELEKLGIALWLVNSNVTNPKIEDILNFQGLPPEATFDQAKDAIFTELDKRNLIKVYENIELPLIPVIKKMQNVGIKVDRDYLNNLSIEYHKEIEEREKKIWSMAGMEFNISSPKQLGEVLFDKMSLVGEKMKKTASGARSTKESELLKLKGLHPIIDLILEYREFSKLVNTYIDTIPLLLDNENRLHTTFNQTGTTTGRMSSTEPNLQNIPIKSDLGKRIRDAFIAEEDFKLVAFDYSQIELRVAAFLSKDEEMIKIFKEGRDIHTEVASRVFGVKTEDVTREMRSKAKTINFGVMYGMGVTALQQNIKSDRKEAQNFLNQYFETFKGLAEYLNKTKIEANLQGYTETFFGRRRYFEGIQSKIPFIKAMAERMAINAPIQGTEADVIKLAMIKIDEYLVKEKLENDAKLLLQVHDELVIEIRENVIDKIAPKIKEIMESIINPEDIFGISLKADYGVGDSWGKCK